MNEYLEYKDLYIQTSREYIQSLNTSLLTLEKDPTNKEAIQEVFRSAHSLKGQSAAMEYESTGFLCHTIEDVFYEIKNNRLTLTPEMADHLFAALDALTDAINHIESENHETNLTQQIEALKQLSGVKTEGSGKTTHNGTESPGTAAPIESPSPPATPESSNSPQPTIEQATPTLADNNTTTSPTINSIAVKVEVLDEMMNLLENLLIERMKLKKISTALSEEHPDLKDYFHVSETILASLQHQIMKARAMPVSLVFNHFPRAVRDLGRAENKQVKLIITGGDLELDRTIVDRLDEPLIHLLRNAVSHGITQQGTITLSGERQKDYAQISVHDDGQGINWPLVAEKAGIPTNETNKKALKDALFSGISTSETVTQISGRGVGLMTIKKMVDNFGGTIDVVSESGKGTTFVIKLPLTLAIAKALIFTVNQRNFAVPMLAVERIISIPAASIKKMATQEVFVLDETDVPLVRLDAKLAPLGGDQPSVTPAGAQDILAIIVGENEQRVGLIVDAVLDSSDIVIKPVPVILKDVSGFSGVTILSDGKTALIINPQELL